MHKTILALMAFVASTAAYAQTTTAPPPPPAEGSGEPISMLMFVTLGLALAIGVFALMWFRRKSSNRAAMDRTLNPNHPDNRSSSATRR